MSDVAMTGLSAREVRDLTEQGKTNAYKEETSRSAWEILRANVFTIFNAILGAALVVILVVGQWQDALFGIVLLLNTATGTVAEVRAKRALDKLAVLDAPHAVVIRDGAEHMIDTQEIVLGDLVQLRSGQQVPADGEVLSSDGLEIDESILTGESVAVRPQAGDTAMSGTTVTAGSGIMRTTAVGGDAYAHRLAREARKFSVVTSELQEGTNRVLRWISWVIVPVTMLLVWSQLRQQGGFSAAWESGDWRPAVILAISGVVGMVPQGLVLLTSVNFATASLDLARKHVLVQELPAVEVLARVDTLCLDKTGTITTGGITLSQVVAPDGQEAGGDVAQALLALTAGQDANATAEAIQEGLADSAAQHQALTVTDAVPFSSARKWSAVAVDSADAGTEYWFMGAPEIIFDSVKDTDSGRSTLSTVEELAGGGVRVVGVARSSQEWRSGEEDAQLPAELEPAGIVVLAEQVREDAPQTLEYFREQGVTVKVISGDNPITVAAVATNAGVTGEDGAELNYMDARELPSTAERPEDLETLAEALDTHTVFGRVTPEQKRAFVQALRSRNHVVAMTGDGVNDALALKDADLGIAMGNGAPATKAVARLVLLTGEFSALPGVVAQGRRVMANTERIASLFLAKTMYASLIAVLVAITAIAYPFMPRQLTIVSSLTIGIPAFILALAPNKQRYRSGFLPRVLSLAIPTGVVAGLATLATRTWLVWDGAANEQVTTGATLVLVACGLWLLTLTARPLLSWRGGLVVTMAACAVLGVFVAPVREFFLLAWPAAQTWTVIAAMSAASIGLIEVVSWVRRRMLASSASHS